jgi:iron-only hydrogenase group A
MEESTEFLKRFEKGENLPILTSCSPGWINFMEHFYPEFIPNASTCKSPMQMTSTLIKTYYAQQKGIDPKDIYVVAIMPCVAKKYEIGRPEHIASEGYPYTDAVLTTRELIWMIKAMGIDFKNLPDGEFDNPMGESTGAAVIFGSTGGVMEATLRTAYTKLTGKKPENLEFTDVRAVEGLRESSVEINGTVLNVAVANGLSNARKILEKVKAGEKQYHIIELMACPGGCISGGGQPLPHAEQNLYPLDPIITEKRRKAIYQIDTAEKFRVSSENPSIKKIYKDFLKKPGSEIAHDLLHTQYSEKYPRGVK